MNCGMPLVAARASAIAARHNDERAFFTRRLWEVPGGATG
jgi:hypothetical protein